MMFRLMSKIVGVIMLCLLIVGSVLVVLLFVLVIVVSCVLVSS